MRKNPTRLLLIVGVLLAGALACNFPTTQSDPISQTSTPLAGLPQATAPKPIQPPSPIPSGIPNPHPAEPSATPVPYQPIFVAAPCAFAVPAGGYKVDCGYVAVPEHRQGAQPGDPMIRLHVAVFRSWANLPAQDPVIHLSGGPGSSALDSAGYMFAQGLYHVLDQRDLVLFDQRGTGHSLPRLDCPERETLTPALLNGSLTAEQRDAAIVEGFKRCHDRLVQEGIDPAAYSSAASAADVNDLRRALGYTQVNLYGVSYGTRLALTVMRDFPEMVRSVVLDSTYPPQVNLYTTLAPNAERAFKVLFERCAADPGCSQYYPQLENTFYDLVDQLNGNPVTVPVKVNGKEIPVVVDGGRLVDVLLVGLYNPEVISEMPLMIAEVKQGSYAILRQRLALYFDNSTALGMLMAVQCGEEIPFSPADEPFRLAQGVRAEVAQFFPNDVQALFTACKDWQTRPLDPKENQAVSSDLPTLILAGEYDPITPPDWGMLAAKTLSNSHFYLIPGQGHWVTRSSKCALDLALAFWSDPAAAPDSSCVEKEKGIYFER